MNEVVKFFFDQWPALWLFLSLAFFVLGVWWAYETWFRAYADRISSARHEFRRLTKLRQDSSRSRGGSPRTGSATAVPVSTSQGVASQNTTSQIGAVGTVGAATAAAGVVGSNLTGSTQPYVAKVAPSTHRSNAGKAACSFSVPGYDGPRTDWLKVPGVDSRIANEFDSLGIHSFDQLENMSSEDRLGLESRLAAKGINWDWKWMHNWKGMGSPRKPAMPQFAGKLEYAKPAISIPTARGPKVNWNERSGVDPRLATEFKTLGITSPDQLEQMSPAARTAFEARLRSKGIDWDWSWTKNWSSPSLSVPAATGPEVNWSSVDGVEPKLASEFASLGVTSPDQLESLSPQDRQAFENRLASKGVRWDWGWLSNWKTLAGFGAATAAGTAAMRSNKPLLRWPITKGAVTKVDWPNIPGIDPKVGAELGSIGAMNVSQLELLSDEQKKEIDGHLQQKGLQLNWAEVGTWQNKVDAASVIEFPPVDDERIDWHSLEGIDTRLADELQSMRVRSVEQIEALPYQERRKFETRLNAKGINWDWAWLPKWKSHLRGIGALQLPQVAGPKVDWYDIDGVNPRIATEFNLLGVQNVEQLRQMPTTERRKLDSHLASKGLEWHWGWLFKPTELREMESQIAGSAKKFVSTASPPAGLLSSPMREKADDLKRINGIGPAIERRLNQSGVFHYEQIASLGGQDLNWIAGQVDCHPDRIKDDEWIEQAKALAQDQSGSFYRGSATPVGFARPQDG